MPQAQDDIGEGVLWLANLLSTDSTFVYTLSPRFTLRLN